MIMAHSKTNVSTFPTPPHNTNIKQGIWSKTLGDDTKYLVDCAIMFQCFASTVVYSGILGDVWTPIFKTAGLPDSINMRKSNIVALATLVLYPLSLIKDLSALAFTSILGFSAVAYTCLLYTSPSPRDRQKSRMPSSA